MSIIIVSVCVSITLVNCVFTSEVAALQIRSQRTPLAESGDSLESFAIAGFRAEQQDFGTTVHLVVTGSDGLMNALSMTCSHVSYLYDVTYIGAVPRSGIYYTTHAFLVRDTKIFKQINPQDVDDPAGRSLLQTSDPVADTPFCQTDACRDDSPVNWYNTVQNAAHNTNPTQFSPANAHQAVCFAFYNDISSSNYKDCAAGTNRKFDLLNSTTAGFLKDLENWTANVTSAETANAQALIDLANQQDNLTRAASDFDKEIKALRFDLNATSLNLDDTLDFVTKELRRQRDDLRSANDRMSDLANNMSAIVNETSLATYQLYLLQTKNFQNFTSEFSSAVDAQQERRRITASQVRATQNLFVATATAFSDLVSGIQLIRRQSVQFAKDKAALEASPDGQGEFLSAFIDPGDFKAPATTPSNLGPLLKSTPIADIIDRYMITSGGNPYGVVTRYTWSCETVNWVTTSSYNPPAPQILDWIGPPDCDVTFTDPMMTKRCRCMIQVVADNRCLLRNSGGIVSAGDAFSFRTGNAIELSSDTGCLVQPQEFPGGMSGTYIRSITDLAASWATVSRRGLYNGTLMQQYSLYADDEVVNSPWSELVSNATDNLKQVLDAPLSGGDPNFVYDQMVLVVHSWGFARRGKQPYETAVYGRLPNFMDETMILWRNLTTNGTSATGYGSLYGVMFYSPKSTMLTVSQFIPTTPVVDITLTVNGANTTVTDIQIDDLYIGLLPTTPGVIWNPSTVQSEFWDTLSKDVAINGNPSARANTLTYAAAYTPDLFERRYLSYFAGRRFDHISGGHVAPAYRVELNNDVNSPDVGRCTSIAYVPSGGWCVMFDHYKMSTFGSFNDHDTIAHVAFQPRSAAVNFFASIPDGAVFFYTTSVCPVIRQIGQPIGGSGQQTITISNPSSSDSSFRVQQLGACPFQKDLRLVAYQTTNMLVRGCLSAPPGQPDQLIFLYLDKQTQTYKDCNSTFALNLTAASINRYQGAASYNFTVYAEDVSSQVLLERIVSSQLNVIRAQSLVALQRVHIMVTRNISRPDDAPNYVADAYETILKLQQQGNDLVAQAAALKQRVSDALKNGQPDQYTGNIGPALVDTGNLIAQHQADFDRQIAAFAANQPLLVADVENARKLGMLQAAEFNSMVDGSMQMFLSAILERLNASVFDPDSLKNFVADVVENDISAQDVQDADDLLNGSVFDAIRVLWRNSALGRLQIIPLVLGSGVPFLYIMSRLIFWCNFRRCGKGCKGKCKGRGRYAGPFDSRAVYKADEEVTSLELQREARNDNSTHENEKDAELNKLVA